MMCSAIGNRRDLESIWIDECDEMEESGLQSYDIVWWKPQIQKYDFFSSSLLICVAFKYRKNWFQNWCDFLSFPRLLKLDKNNDVSNGPLLVCAKDLQRNAWSKASQVNVNKVYLTSGVRSRHAWDILYLHSRVTLSITSDSVNPLHIPVASLLLNFYYIAFCLKFANHFAVLWTNQR